MKQLTIKRGDEMRKIILLVLALSLLGFSTSPHDVPEWEPTYKGRFSDDPLIDSVREAQYWDSIRKCADKNCD
jgi:hypothetical protein